MIQADLQVFQNQNSSSPNLLELADRLKQFIGTSDEQGLEFVSDNDEILILYDRLYPSTFLKNFTESFEVQLEQTRLRLCISILNPYAKQLYFSLPEILKPYTAFYCPYFGESTDQYFIFQNLILNPNIFLTKLRSSSLTYLGALVFRHSHLTPIKNLDSKIFEAIENLQPLLAVNRPKIKTLITLFRALDISSLLFMMRANEAKVFRNIFTYNHSDLLSVIRMGWCSTYGAFQRFIYFPLRGIIHQLYGKLLIRLYWYLRSKINIYNPKIVLTTYWPLYTLISRVNGHTRRVAVTQFWRARHLIDAISEKPVKYYWIFRRTNSRFYWKIYRVLSRSAGEMFFLSGKIYGLSVRAYWKYLIPCMRFMFFPVIKFYYFSAYQFKHRILKSFNSSPPLDKDI